MKTQAVIDRFEGSKAVLVTEDDSEVILPQQILPPDARQGDCLQIEITVDEEATNQARQTAENLLQRLLEQNQQ